MCDRVERESGVRSCQVMINRNLNINLDNQAFIVMLAHRKEENFKRFYSWHSQGMFNYLYHTTYLTDIQMYNVNHWKPIEMLLQMQEFQ